MNIILKNENLYGGIFSMGNQNIFPDELIRLEIKQLAEDVRYKYSKKGLSDIFDILAEDAFLLRMPLKTNEVSGFSTYFQEKFVVFLNSSFTLGHERYSGAHELYHIIYNQEILKNEKLLLNDPKTVEDKKADIFAAEFLMPEDYIKEVFYKIINVKPDNVIEKHIVKMNNFFKVSYKAMLKRLVQLNLCERNKYQCLSEICSLENADKLQLLTKKEGYNIKLIIPSNEKFVPKEYIEYIKTNYENKKISFNNMKNCFNFIGMAPMDFGYEYPSEEEL